MLFLYFFYEGKTFCASFVHGLMSIFFMFLISEFPHWGSVLAKYSLLNSFLYFIVDLFFRPDLQKYLHHLFSASACILTVLFYPEIQIYIAKAAGILELSNPFWTLLRIRIEQSTEIKLPKWYSQLQAGIVFIIVFFYGRIILFTRFALYDLPSDFPPILFNLLFYPLFFLNIYWMWLLVKGFIKEIRKLVD